MPKTQNKINPDITVPNRDTSLLAPWLAVKAQDAIDHCNEAGYPIAMFEGHRSTARQEFLFAQGRTRPGKKITYAKPWESFHNYGLALDPVFFDGRKWSWEGPWDKVHAIFHEHGFETLDFEKSHVEITGGMKHQEAYLLFKEQGMQAVWDAVLKRLSF